MTLKAILGKIRLTTHKTTIFKMILGMKVYPTKIMILGERKLLILSYLKKKKLTKGYMKIMDPDLRMRFQFLRFTPSGSVPSDTITTQQYSVKYSLVATKLNPHTP